MKVLTVSANRELVLRVLEGETGQAREYRGLPEFSYCVGTFTLARDGAIYTDDDASTEPLDVLASLGLVDWPYSPAPPEPSTIAYPMRDFAGQALVNLLCMISARAPMLNRALAAPPSTFRAGKPLMRTLLNHPPETPTEFLQALYGRTDEYAGIAFTLGHVNFPGFAACPPEDSPIHRQLADLMVAAACEKSWTKAFGGVPRNQRYVFRTWLNDLGMTGHTYEHARTTLLGRLPGTSDRRRQPNRKEG